MMTRGLSACVAVAVVGVSGALTGCVVSIGNDRDGLAIVEGSQRIRLTSEERASLPVVTTLADLPTVRTRYAHELAQLTPQTTVTSFQALFPTARFVERREISQGQNTPIDAYSVSLRERFRYRSESYGVEARDEMWFYFSQGTLVKSGVPHNWP